MADDILPPGHVLAFYTDGLFEVIAEDGQQLGCAGLSEKLAALSRECGESSATIAAKCFEAVSNLQGEGMASDDQSLLVVRRAMGSG
jgi:serine phosphatase RsbU (regulator of sigma subunit)